MTALVTEAAYANWSVLLCCARHQMSRNAEFISAGIYPANPATIVALFTPALDVD